MAGLPADPGARRAPAAVTVRDGPAPGPPAFDSFSSAPPTELAAALGSHEERAARFSRLGFDESHVRVDSQGTILPADSPREQPLTPADLPCISLQTKAGDATMPQLVLGEVLGEGGMGVVRAAVQMPLRREVAVKTVRAELSDPTVRSDLLREALVTGRLAHPNIAPVHLLARDERGEPLIVMKRVEGVAWRDLLLEPGLIERFSDGGKEPLDFHLEVLMKVAQTVAFAHSKGIVHRDLKPDNVMLGAHGEVYVVDWGLAVTLFDDPQLPRACDVRTIAGTPGYMAPEMAYADPRAIGAGTDIYLLGAILHELLTGKRRHQGANFTEQMLRAAESRPMQYDASVPEDLGLIANHATRPSPTDRFGSADEFRRAISAYLQHTSSRRLAARAHQRLERLAALVAREQRGLHEDAGRVHTVFAECQFGFQEALSTWADNPAAHEGLRRAIGLMAEFELERANVDGAAAFLALLPRGTRPELESRLIALREDGERRVRTLEALERYRQDSDLEVAARGRSLLCLGTGFFWGLSCFLVELLVQKEWLSVGYREAGVCLILFVVQMAVGTAVARRLYPENLAARRLTRAGLYGAGLMMLFWGMSWQLGLRFTDGLVLFTTAIGTVWILVGVSLDTRMIIAGLSFVGSGVLMVIVGRYHIALFGLGTLVGFTGLGWVWARTAVAPAADPEAGLGR